AASTRRISARWARSSWARSATTPTCPRCAPGPPSSARSARSTRAFAASRPTWHDGSRPWLVETCQGSDPGRARRGRRASEEGGAHSSRGRAGCARGHGARGHVRGLTPAMTQTDTRRLTHVTHPLVQHKLSYLRDRDTPTVHFRKLVDEVTLLLTYEATKDFPIEEVEIETPLERAVVPRISGKKVAVCPVLRAGVGMLDGVLSLISSARVGFIGLYRDESTLEAIEYYVKLPSDLAERDAIVLDPMLATGNSSVAAIREVRDAGARSVILVCIVAAPQGI